jgi:uncharacterized SAM-binding protein YcdF (DUF218 family)
MAGLIGYVISGAGLVVCVLVGALWMIAAPRSSGPRRWLVLVAVFYAILSVHAVTRLASRPLVAPFHQFSLADAPSPPDTIILLGGGVRTVHGRYQKTGLLNMSGAARVLEAARIYGELGSRPWVISSGGAAPGVDTIPEAEAMRDELVQLGVPADRIVLESGSHTTHDEAVMIRPMLDRLRTTSVLLVTADIHMRRSLDTFRHAGIDAIPAVARDPLESQRWLMSVVPTNQGLEFGAEVMHEYVGLLWYRVRGWR